MKNQNQAGVIGGGDASGVAEMLNAGKQIATNSQTPIQLPGGVQVIVTPEGDGSFTVLSLESFVPPHARSRPVRKLGNVVVHDIPSFIEFVKLHGEKDATVVFIDVSESGARFTAILNANSKDKANHEDHRVIYTCKPSIEWNRWMQRDKQAMVQQAFIEHLESCQSLIQKPAAADLIVLMQNLQGRNDAAFKQAYNQFNGSFSVTYDETVVVSGASTTKADKMDVPTSIGICVSPFENSAKYKMDARLRLRVDNRKLVFAYETVDPHLAVKDVVNEMKKKVSEELKAPVLLGSAPN